MTQTSTQTPLGVRNNRAVGRFLDTSTAGSILITCGFKPRYVKVVNNTSQDEEQWFEGMADGTAHKRLAAGTATALATLGITPTAAGFTIGLDTDIVVISEQLSWIAEG